MFEINSSTVVDLHQVDAQEPAGPLTFFSSPCRELRWVSRLSALSVLPPWNLTGDIPHTLETYITHIHAQSSYNTTVQI